MVEEIQIPVEPPDDSRIALPEMADDLQCHKQTLFKIAKRLGIVPVKRRDIDRKNQLVATVSRSEALILRQEFLTRARTNTGSDEGGDLIADDGVFYLVQLEPEHDPGRIKVGFTTDLDGRLRKHRCSAPFAQCVKTWPCRRNWERAAIDCVTNSLEQLHTEVFRTKSIDEVSARGDQFFSIMPGVIRSEDQNAD
jgi:hypothetical protein